MRYRVKVVSFKFRNQDFFMNNTTEHFSSLHVTAYAIFINNNIRHLILFDSMNRSLSRYGLPGNRSPYTR